MDPEVHEVCGCIEHASYSLHVVRCVPKELVTASLATLDQQTGRYETAVVQLRRGFMTSRPGRLAIGKTTHGITKALVYECPPPPALRQFWEHTPTSVVDVGPFDTVPDAPMPGQVTLFE